jgi:hypothetical protein
VGEDGRQPRGARGEVDIGAVESAADASDPGGDGGGEGDEPGAAPDAGDPHGEPAVGGCSGARRAAPRDAATLGGFGFLAAIAFLAGRPRRRIKRPAARP